MTSPVLSHDHETVQGYRRSMKCGKDLYVREGSLCFMRSLTKGNVLYHVKRERQLSRGN